MTPRRDRGRALGEERWPGAVVRDVLGLVLGADEETEPLDAMLGLALRRNPRRAHLPVSRVLGKHVPIAPGRVRAAAEELARRTQDCLERARGGTGGPVVVGYAENATGLCHLVADALDADYVVHTTRRTVPGAAVLTAFEEEHSHAPHHVLVPDAPDRWTPERAVVLVDDELSTGRTVAATVRSLHRRLPRHHYVVATLADLRDRHDPEIPEVARDLAVRIDVVALTRATLTSPPDVLERAARELADAPDAVARPTVRPSGRRAVATVRLPLADAAESARHGLDRADRAALDQAVPAAAAALVDALPPEPGRVLVLGCEELHYLPIRLAEVLAARGLDVEVGATSRSPLAARDVPGYPVRSALGFAAHDTDTEATAERFAYNLGTPGAGRYDTVAVVVDTPAHTASLHGPDGLLSRLSTVTGRVLLAVAPCRGPRAAEAARPRRAGPAARRGPEFGTFAPDEVGWLLSDLSHHALETPLAAREAALHSGRHYSDTLPEERRPSHEYAEVVERTLERTAAATAAAVGVLADRLLARQDQVPVLVSLARAGTPVGVLVRRWARAVRGVLVPHYSMSVVRGRGLDRAALDALTAAYDPSSLTFVDGWTGSGEILRETRADLARYAERTGQEIDPTVAVLADPAHCTPLHGTRDDLLVPQACLNATVSGLVSRTVARAELVAPGAYHGAKFYPGLAEADRTARFLDTVSACFPSASTAPDDVTPGSAADEQGPRYLAAFARSFALPRGQRPRAGCGETLRALLRRDPAAVYLAPDAGGDLDPVRQRCAERAVPVLPLPDRLAGIPSPYRCLAVLRAPTPPQQPGGPPAGQR